MANPHRARLQRFYEKYNPSKLGAIDQTLEAYAGREEEMFTALVGKYGPEPPAAVAAAGSISGATKNTKPGGGYRERLVRFYEAYNPSKLGAVDQTLEAYAGREEEMFTALVGKYGAEPPAAAAVAPTTASESARSRLTRFYEKYNPSKLGSVDQTLEAYAGREEEMFTALVGKYGPEPPRSSSANPTSAVTSSRKPSSGNSGATGYRDRLVRFYEKYNPSKLNAVDQTLEAYAGREEEMFTALVGKYGAEPGATTTPPASDKRRMSTPPTGSVSATSNRDRLLRFYQAYNPSKVGAVDQTLEAYAGREEEMFTALVGKYGQEPTAAAGSAGGSNSYKQRLSRFYEKYNPSKLGAVDQTLEAYAGREEEMFTALCHKYGPEPPGGDATSAQAAPKRRSASQLSSGPAASTGTVRERLTRFYEKYNPAKLASVQQALEAYAGREEEMFVALVTKYGPEPPPPSTSSAQSRGVSQMSGGGGDAPASASYRERLVRFYEKHNPAKLSSVDQALEAYAGREEEMFTALVGKYGPEPPSAGPAISAGSTFKLRLTRFYEKYNPSKLGAVDQTLEAYAGREEEMFTALVGKYGPEPAQQRSSSGGPTANESGSFKGRLIRFYEKYNPGNIGAVDQTLEAYAGREEEMFTALVGKYGPEPVKTAPIAAASAAGGSISFKDRLTRFYEKYNPSKLGAVDQTLEAYAGREEEMFTALVGKYGPEPTSAPSTHKQQLTPRERLIRFYEKYNPAKVGAVDQTLEAYAGREEEMFTALVGKYGPEPPSTMSTPSTPGTTTLSSSSSYKQRLTRFYEKYNPAKIGAVDQTLEAYAGREEEMFTALVGKYGPEPPFGTSQTTVKSGNGGGGSYRDRLVRFYTTYNPTKVAAVDDTLAAYAGREEAMFAALVGKYGAEPQTDAAGDSAGGGGSAAASSHASFSYRDRLSRFYEKYNPAKLSAVDQTLQAYAGREEEMFVALVGKYGAEPPAAPTQPRHEPKVMTAPQSYQERLLRFYEKYNPAKVNVVDQTLTAYAGREEEMFTALVSKYGPEPLPASSALVPAAVNVGASAETSGREMTEQPPAGETGDAGNVFQEVLARLPGSIRAVVLDSTANQQQPMPSSVGGSSSPSRQRDVDLLCAAFNKLAEAASSAGQHGVVLTAAAESPAGSTAVAAAEAERQATATRLLLLGELQRMEELQRTRLKRYDASEWELYRRMFRLASRRLTAQHACVQLIASTVTFRRSHFFHLWAQCAAQRKHARLEEKKAGLTYYQQLTTKKTAAAYYDRLRQEEERRASKIAEAKAKEQQQRSQRLKTAFERGDFVRQNTVRAKSPVASRSLPVSTAPTAVTDAERIPVASFASRPSSSSLVGRRRGRSPGDPAATTSPADPLPGRLFHHNNHHNSTTAMASLSSSTHRLQHMDAMERQQLRQHVLAMPTNRKQQLHRRLLKWGLAPPEYLRDALLPPTPMAPPRSPSSSQTGGRSRSQDSRDAANASSPLSGDSQLMDLYMQAVLEQAYEEDDAAAMQDAAPLR